MDKTPKSLRVQIGLFGRTNVGKSSFLNMVSSQDVSIISSVPGTTTDIVEKPMELLPLGPVVFLDTGGVDDVSILAKQRIKRTEKVFDRADVVLLIVETNQWTEHEDFICSEAVKRKLPLMIVVNKSDVEVPADDFLTEIRRKTKHVLICSSVATQMRDIYLSEFKNQLSLACPEGFLKNPTLIGDLLPPGGHVILIVPIDLQAPKGRLILPQVQAIRDVLDNDAVVTIVKEREYSYFLENLKQLPDLVVCDSQVVMKMVADTPPEVKCTTFSILFSRYKSDLIQMAKGAAQINLLKPNDKVLIAEACSHHAMEDDIGRVKIPRWMRQYVGADLEIDVFSGRDWPEDLEKYQLIVHCGSCMLTRGETLMRLEKAKELGVDITNYGLCISVLQGVMERALSPFPAALEAYLKNLEKLKGGDVCHAN